MASAGGKGEYGVSVEGKISMECRSERKQV
jgi:hypothetical protein